LWFSGQKRRRRDARETTQPGLSEEQIVDALRQVEGARRSARFVGRWVYRSRHFTAGSGDTPGWDCKNCGSFGNRAGRKSQAERDRSGPHVGQAHFAGSAIKKGSKPVKHRELVRQLRQAYQLSENCACGLMRITTQPDELLSVE
jgi:hypothetical protein